MPQCNVCSQEFKHYSSLSRHRKIHVKDAWDCGTCNTTFSSPRALKRHQKQHAQATSVALTCHICFSEFDRPNALAAHALLHLPPDQRPDTVSSLKCGHCYRAFARKASLQKHQATCRAGLVSYEPSDTVRLVREANERYIAFLQQYEELVRWRQPLDQPLPAPGIIRRGAATTLDKATLEDLSLVLELDVDGEPIWTYGILVEGAGAPGFRILPLRSADWQRLCPVSDLSGGNRGHDGLPRFSTQYFRRRAWSQLFTAFRRTECSARPGNDVFCCAICHVFHLPVSRLPARVQEPDEPLSPSSDCAPTPSRDLSHLRDTDSASPLAEAAHGYAQRAARLFGL